MQKSPIGLVSMGRDGQLVEVENDVLSVCEQIRQVSPTLGVEFNLRSEQYRIYEACEDGRRRTVMWTPELTGDIPNHLRRIAASNYIVEMRRRDEQAERDQDHRLHELVGPIGEKLAHAARKDKQVGLRIFVPKDVN